MRKDGEYYILEHPKPGVTYYAGTDPIPMGDKKEIRLGSDERSYHVTCILKGGSDPTPVAYYKVRSNDSWMVYHNTMRLQRYYNDCLNNIEKNAASVLLTRYTDDGTYSRYLASFPYATLVPGWEKTKIDGTKLRQKGWNKDVHTQKPAFDALAEYLTVHAGNIWIPEIITEIEDYQVKNCDLLDAFLSALIYYYHTMRLVSKRGTDEKPEYIGYYGLNAQGQMSYMKAKVGGKGEKGHDGFGVIR